MRLAHPSNRSQRWNRTPKLGAEDGPIRCACDDAGWESTISRILPRVGLASAMPPFTIQTAREAGI